jgi:hypothetical protein
MNVREAVLRSLQSGNVHQHGKEFPRIGYYGHDERGILQELLYESCDTVPGYILILEPLLHQMRQMLEKVEAGELSPVVGRALWLRSVKELVFHLPIDPDVPVLDYDLALDTKASEWACDLEEHFYDLDDGSCWIHVESSAFWNVLSQMPPDSDLGDVACAVLRVDPRAFICVIDNDGVFVYASPEADCCSATPPGSMFRGTAVGEATTPGSFPTFVLPDKILRDFIETCTAATEESP